MRINIIGGSGSGKTTFGRRLAEILEVPFIEMDAIYWGPGWSEPEDKDFFRKVSQALQADSWVLDGNYSRTTSLKWERVQAVIWIDFSFPRTIYQSVTRAVSRLLSREELWPGTGNRETLGKLFSRESIVLFAITSYWRKRARIRGLMESPEFAQISFHRLRSPAEADGFLTQIRHNPNILFKNKVKI